MRLTMKNLSGQDVSEIDLSDTVFSAPINKQLMHQALIRQLANARLGTHKTKTRKEVRGGGRKPWRQKGTGRARQGSIRAPQWVGGGTVFGPQPRKYNKSMPKKMRRAALRSALSVKAASSDLVVVEELALESSKTRAVVDMLRSLSLNDSSVLLLWAGDSNTHQRAARNLSTVKTLHAGYLNIRDLLGYDKVLMSKETVDYIEGWLALPEAVEEEE